MKKICVFLADGFEEIEAVCIIDVLRRGDMDVNIVSITDSRLVEGAHGIKITADTLFDEMDYDSTDALILPGGMPGTLNLGNHDELCRLLTAFNQKDKFIGAICAAPSILGKLGILEGRRAVCYPGFEEKMKGAKVEISEVVRDNNIITGKGPAVAMNFALQVLELYKDTSYVRGLAKSLGMN